MNSLIRTFSKLFLISIGLRVVDVIKNLYIASKLGVTDQADVFLSLTTVPDALLILFGLDSLRGIVNSEYSSEQNKARFKISDSFNNLFRALLVIGIVITAIILFFNNGLIRLLYPGFTDQRFELAVQLSVFVLPVFFIKPVSALLYAYYNSVKQYYIPVVPQVLVSLSIIFFVAFPVFSSELIVNISFGFLIGNILYFVILVFPQISNENVHLLAPFKFDPLTKKIIRNCMTLFFVVVINQVYLFTKNFFVSYFDEGSLAAINYGSSLPAFISSLTFAVVFGILLNNLSKLHSLNLIEEANRLLSNTINSIIYIYVPVVIILIMFDISILNILYLRGNFDSSGIMLTSIPFFWESLSLIPFVFFIMPVAKYLAFKEYKKYSRIGIIIYVGGIFINFLLVKLVGFYGVSIGTFAVYFIMGAALIYFSDFLSSKYEFNIVDSYKLLVLGGFVLTCTFFLKKYFLDVFFIRDSLYVLFAGSFFVILLYILLTILLNLNYLDKIKFIIRNEN